MRHLILHERLGGHLDADIEPIAVWRGQVDLATLRRYCESAESDTAVDASAYEVRSVEIPDWLDPDDWIEDIDCWASVWLEMRRRGVNPAAWPESWQRALVRFPVSERVLAVELLARPRCSASAARHRLRLVAKMNAAHAVVVWPAPLYPPIHSTS